jgi:hypothetical protein
MLLTIFYFRMDMELSSYRQREYAKNMSIYVGVNNAIFMPAKKFFLILIGGN